ncbi:MAG: hypothetical protein ACT4P7_15635 [Gemmatimonadaceae bacterium]
MTLARPSAIVTLNGQRLTSAEGGVARVRVRLGMGPAHDELECFCWPSSKLKGAAPGGTLTVALGSAGSEGDVFAGEVSGVRLAPDGVAIEGLAGTVPLSRTFVSQSFLDLSIADIVRQLADTAGVTVGDASGDMVLSCYAVDDRRSVWAHINELAYMAGADVLATNAGALKFVAPAAPAGGPPGGGLLASAAALVLGGGPGGLRVGANVTGWRATTRKAPEPATVAALGSGSESGSDKWHWIRLDQSPVGAGPALVMAPLGTRDAASAAADVLSSWSKRAERRTTLVVVGDASLRPGQVTKVSDIPGDAGGDLRLIAVEHTLDGDAGFLSRLTLEPAA